MKPTKTSRTTAILLILLVYGVMLAAGITCPIKYLIGISCPGCGMTRAWLSFLQGSFSAAFAYHPLFLLAVPAVIVLLLGRKLGRWQDRLLLIMGVACCIVYLIRLFEGNSDVVVFAPKEGFFWRTLSNLVHALPGV